MERLAQEYDVRVRWRGFPLHPEIPPEGITFRDLFADYPMDIEQITARMQQTAKGLGLPFIRQDRICNTRLAQELGLWAETRGKGPAFHAAAFKAYFAAGQNLAESQVLVDLTTSLGLPAADAGAVLAERQFRSVLDADWDLARRRGITAVPTLAVGPDKLVGAQPYENMAAFIESRIPGI